jgi:hypothetical protein
VLTNVPLLYCGSVSAALSDHTGSEAKVRVLARHVSVLFCKLRSTTSQLIDQAIRTGVDLVG